MSSDAQLFGGRLRELRQANGKSQAEVAQEFGASRSTIAQMELGNRKVQAEELGRLARIYGCSPTSLLAIPAECEDREPDELLSDLRQAVPEFSIDPTAFKGLRQTIILSRELTMLEKTLGLEGYAAGPPSHGFGSPSTRWEGAHQGYVAAQEERWRMNLGDAPIRDVDDTLAMMRVRATQTSLPRGILSLYLQAPETGTLVVVNAWSSRRSGPSRSSPSARTTTTSASSAESTRPPACSRRTWTVPIPSAAGMRTTSGTCTSSP